jgi:hypothetical protein
MEGEESLIEISPESWSVNVISEVQEFKFASCDLTAYAFSLWAFLFPSRNELCKCGDAVNKYRMYI